MKDEKTHKHDEAPARTRLQIATELDTAEREYAAALLVAQQGLVKVKELAAELRAFGVKKRAPKGTP